MVCLTKIAILNDIHFGVRNDNLVLRNHQGRFYSEVFFPYLLNNNIKDILVLGDMFDRRKSVNFETLDYFVNNFFKKAKGNNITIHCIVGNHDVYYKNTNRVNSVDLLVGQYVNHITEAGDYEFFDTKVCVIPWMTEDNTDDCNRALSYSLAKDVFGHFDIVGFDMGNGMMSTHGLDPKVFKRFRNVYSGHYHSKSSKGNITYLGGQYDMDAGDIGADKGFHVYEPTTGDIQYITNPNKIYQKITYDPNKDYQSQVWFGVDDIEGKFVRLVTSATNNEPKFMAFYDLILGYNPHNVSLSMVAETIVGSLDISSVEIDTTEDMIKNVVDIKVEPEHKPLVQSKLFDLLKRVESDG